MKTGVICIGDELLKGATINTNAGVIGVNLLENGIMPTVGMTTRDDAAEISAALDYMLPRCDAVILTGGLGPTADDITKPAVVAYFKRRLYENEAMAERIKTLWRRYRPDDSPPSRVMDQALIPEGAEVLPNEVGTAPGFLLRTDDEKMVFVLPGPPREMTPMLRNFVLPVLRESTASAVAGASLRLAGLPESMVEARMMPLLTGSTVSVAYCANLGETRLFLLGKDGAEVKRLEAAAAAEFADAVLPNNISLPEHVLSLCRGKGLRLATAESCTGGMIAAALTDVPGASDVFLGGVIAYANEIKRKTLEVSAANLRVFGAVSAEVAGEMAIGAAERFNANAAIAVTGIAGPDGGTVEKPVGLVFSAIALNGGLTVERHLFTGNRGMIRQRTVTTAMNRLRHLLLD